MSRRAIVLVGLVAAILAFAVSFAITAQRARPTAERLRIAPSASASGALPVLWKVPVFSFPDQNGRTTAARELEGHVWIADFVFTSCTSICPLITAKMALLQRRLEHRDLRFVSFSVDPERDSPEALKLYADAWRPGESRWILFSTTKPGLESLAKGMFVAVEPGEKDIGHSNLFFLVDQKGGVRGIYESDRDDALERLVHDARSLSGTPRAEPEQGRQAASGSELYAALGCGACHARSELAPPLEGLLGRPVKLKDGVGLVANTAYIRESIVAPNAKVVADYPLAMPSYEGDLTAVELDELVEYVRRLQPAPLSTAKPKASAAGAPTSAAAETAAAPSESADVTGEPVKPANERAMVAVDPVCSMTVRVTDTTPRTTHAGHTVYFCSDTCKNKFLAEPARYTQAPTP